MDKSRAARRRNDKDIMRALFATALLVLLSACTTPQIHSTVQVREINFKKLDLRSAGIAFVTPSSVTGQEEDRQALAFTFTEVLQRSRPELQVLQLPETLSAINGAGLADDYRAMAEDYRVTGIFERDILRKLAQATKVRYLAQLKLAGFRQDSRERWGILGLRIFETKSTTLRLFLQIWDSSDGSVAWEGTEELTFSYDSVSEGTVTFRGAVEQASRELISRLP